MKKRVTARDPGPGYAHTHSPASAKGRKPLLACLILAGLSVPLTANATTYTLTVNADGTFSYNGAAPNLTIRSGDVVKWTGLTRRDSIVRVDGITPSSSPANICFDASLATPDYSYPHKKAYNPSNDNEFTGPIRRGLSGIWALAPEGNEPSFIEVPSAESDAIVPNALTCGALNHVSANQFSVPDPANPGMNKLVKYSYEYLEKTFGTSKSNPLLVTPVTAVDRALGVAHRLCVATAHECDANGLHCKNKTVDPSALYLGTIPDGTYLNGVLSSTYRNPDVTGVVLRFNWSQLQYDNAGTIQYNWTHLDRELERAIKYGKYVTIDVRAGMFGTPAWIFDDYLDAASPEKASWCAAAPCAFASAPTGAGLVSAIEFLDHYDEDAPGSGCGSLVRIGAPGDTSYRALYKGFIAGLAAHLATDARWFQAVAHVKASGANLRTSEAELPHHCDDAFLATGDHQLDPKDLSLVGEDRVLDTFKEVDPSGSPKVTFECKCNSKIWFNHGYTPTQLYDYYAEVENQILASFFGRKSVGYQILQAGFPRADFRANGTGSFFGDHLYEETLIEEGGVPGAALVNTCTTSPGDLCTPAVAAGYFCENDVASCPGEMDLCSPDTLALYGESCWLATTPLSPMTGHPDLSAYPTAASGNLAAGARYPGATEQSETVLAQAASGRFGDPATPNYANDAVGKLFVPQHSGLQPLSQERVELDYAGGASAECTQQLARITPPALLPAGIGALGPYVAAFPIRAGTPVSGLNDAAGCPNEWIVEEGIRDIGVNTPPQLTGFQTTNAVHDLDDTESALFNLVYNTNAVFVELYEDAIWRSALEKGTSGDATPPLPLSSRAPGSLCQYTTAGGVLSDELCYSKTFPQWAEELHYRRAVVAELYRLAVVLGFAGPNGYVALENPFPTEHSFTFNNGTLVAKTFYFINPDKCNSATVDVTGVAASNSLGKIVVNP